MKFVPDLPRGLIAVFLCLFVFCVPCISALAQQPGYISFRATYPKPPEFSQESWDQAADQLADILALQGVSLNAVPEIVNIRVSSSGLIAEYDRLPVDDVAAASAQIRQLYGSAPWVLTGPSTESLEEEVPEITHPESEVNLMVGRAYYTIISASNSPTAVGHVGDFPPGISRSGSTLFGTPTEEGEWSVELTATNAGGIGSQNVLFIVEPPKIVSPEEDEIIWTPDELTSLTIEANNQPNSFFIVGALPPGVSLVGSILGGTPTEAGEWSITVNALNTNDRTLATKPLKITVENLRMMKSAVELAARLRDLHHLKENFQEHIDSAKDIDPELVSVESQSRQVGEETITEWQVRIAPKVPEAAQRLLQTGTTIYEWSQLIVKAAKEGLFKVLGEKAEEEAMSRLKEFLGIEEDPDLAAVLIGLGTMQTDLTERVVAYFSTSIARENFKSRAEAAAKADSIRKDAWQGQVIAADMVAEYNPKAQYANELVANFFVDLEAAQDLNEFQKAKIRNVVSREGRLELLEYTAPAAPARLADQPNNSPAPNARVIEPGGQLTLPPLAIRPLPRAAQQQLRYQWMLVRDDAIYQLEETGPTIVVDSVSESDSGTYVRVTFDSENNVIAREVFEVVVMSDAQNPPEFEGEDQEISVMVGSPLLIDPYFVSDGTYAIDWYRDGELIAESTGPLLIAQSKLSDTGTYVAFARNAAGQSDPALANVTVTSPPPPPPAPAPTMAAPAPAPDPRLAQLASLESQLMDARKIKNPKARANRLKMLNKRIIALKAQIAGGSTGGGGGELAALQKQLADARRIKNPKVRARMIASINAKIRAL